MSEVKDTGRSAVLQLRFKPSTVRKFEKDNNKLTSSLTPDLDNLNLLVRAGNNNCDEETADGILDDFFAAGGDIFEALFQVIEALERGGFLKKDTHMSRAMRKKMETAVKKQMEKLEAEELEEKQKA